MCTFEGYACGDGTLNVNFHVFTGMHIIFAKNWDKALTDIRGFAECHCGASIESVQVHAQAH